MVKTSGLPVFLIRFIKVDVFRFISDQKASLEKATV